MSRGQESASRAAPRLKLPTDGPLWSGYTEIEGNWPIAHVHCTPTRSPQPRRVVPPLYLTADPNEAHFLHEVFGCPLSAAIADALVTDHARFPATLAGRVGQRRAQLLLIAFYDHLGYWAFERTPSLAQGRKAYQAAPRRRAALVRERRHRLVRLRALLCEPGEPLVSLDAPIADADGEGAGEPTTLLDHLGAAGGYHSLGEAEQYAAPDPRALAARKAAEADALRYDPSAASPLNAMSLLWRLYLHGDWRRLEALGLRRQEHEEAFDRAAIALGWHPLLSTEEAVAELDLGARMPDEWRKSGAGEMPGDVVWWERLGAVLDDDPAIRDAAAWVMTRYNDATHASRLAYQFDKGGLPRTLLARTTKPLSPPYNRNHFPYYSP